MAVTMRHIEPQELDEFCSGVRDADKLHHRLRGDLEAGTVRPEWCWLAVDGSRVLARHHWWGPVGADAPVVFVPVSSEHLGAAVDLVAAARDAIAVDEAWAEVTLTGPGDPWTDRPDDVALLEDTGFEFQVDRVRVEWTAAASEVEPGSARLRFAVVHDFAADDVVELFAAVADGSLDDNMRRERERLGRRPEAVKRLHFLRGFPGMSGRLFVAADTAGGLLGYVAAPESNDVGVIAEIGVSPQHRGRGYVDDLLRHGLRVFADTGVPRVVADTDIGNTPMRAAFARNGFREFARRWDWGWRRG